MNNTMPAELLLFLGLQEQKDLGFDDFNLIRTTSLMNLVQGNARFEIRSHKEKVTVLGKTDVYYNINAHINLDPERSSE
jgi:hypothetical protein